MMAHRDLVAGCRIRHPDHFCSGRRVAALVEVGALSVIATAAVAQQQTLPVFVNGEAQVVPGFNNRAEWIQQQLWVETEFDSDGDGKRDRVYVQVTRPRQTETEGLKVPVVYTATPYNGRWPRGPLRSQGEVRFWDVKQEVGAMPPPRTSALPRPSASGPYTLATGDDDGWVPRGFAMVYSDSPGTGRSQGCPTAGGANESLASKAVIDWLNSRAHGFTTAEGNEAVVASWATGKVGMEGVSYEGTLALAAATTGVPGLAAILAISPLTSYYHYYRSNGLVRHPGGYLGEDIDVLYDYIHTGNPERRAYCDATVRDGELARGQDRVTGDYNPFWAGRDYLAKVKKIKAAVLLVHGFNDWNTMPEQSVRIYEALKAQQTPVQVYFHQGDHGRQPPMGLVNRWFTRYLYGVQNRVEQDPRVWIVRENAPDQQTPTPYADYPNPAAAAVRLYLQRGGPGLGGLSLAKRAGQGQETLTDDVAFSGSALAQAERSDHRLLYATAALTEAVHLSGWATITLRLASSKPAANLSVWLVALPAPPDSAGPVTVLTRGWADPQNHQSLTHGEPLVPGRFYPLAFKLQPEDAVIPAGRRIGLMLFSSDRDFTLWPQPGTALTVDGDATSIVLPVVGGAAALGRAFGPVGPPAPPR